MLPGEGEDDSEDRPADRYLIIVAAVFWWLVIVLFCCGLWALDLPACWLGC